MPGRRDLRRSMAKKIGAGAVCVRLRTRAPWRHGLTVLLALHGVTTQGATSVAAPVSDADATTVSESHAPEQEAGEFDVESEIELIATRRRNTSLGREADDEVYVTERELQLQFRYRSDQRMSALGEVKFIGKKTLFGDARPSESGSGIERGETWVQIARLFGGNFALRVGRQNIAEPRRWWWDDDLDAVRLYYGRDPVRFYFGVAQELAREASSDGFIDPEQERVWRLFGHASWRRSEALTLAAFYLNHSDNSGNAPVGELIDAQREDDSDAHLRWIGGRASGDIDGSSGALLSYWADAAVVTGDETFVEYEEDSPGSSVVSEINRRRVRGEAVDLGLVWIPGLWGNPTLTLSYARGSGDKNPADGTDRSFRQTGLQDQDEELRSYGELLRPELSNLSVVTAALGVMVRGRSRVTLGYHDFRQVHRASILRSAILAAEPDGRNKEIGNEYRLLIEIREWNDIEIDVALATFAAGRAFGAERGARAHAVFCEFVLKF